MYNYQRVSPQITPPYFSGAKRRKILTLLRKSLIKKIGADTPYFLGEFWRKGGIYTDIPFDSEKNYLISLTVRLFCDKIQTATFITKNRIADNSDNIQIITQGKC